MYNVIALSNAPNENKSKASPPGKSKKGMYQTFFLTLLKGPYFNYVSTFLSIFDQISTLVSILTTVPDNSYSTVVSILQTK